MKIEMIGHTPYLSNNEVGMLVYTDFYRQQLRRFGVATWGIRK